VRLKSWKAPSAPFSVEDAAVTELSTDGYIAGAPDVIQSCTIFSALLRRVYSAAAERGYSYLMIGFDEHDPLLKIARSYSHIAYRSRIFLAGWNQEANIFERFYEQLDDRVPYVEIAAL